MVLSMTLKQLFGLAAAAWILFILASAVTIGSLMGDSVPQLLMFLGMALLPPSLLYLLSLPRSSSNRSKVQKTSNTDLALPGVKPATRP
jgi:hypothetical protein